jgi:hypothetical protein
MKNIIVFTNLVLALNSLDSVAACRIGDGPDMGDGIPYCYELDDTQETLALEPKWQSRWGAIAIDPNVTSGGIGYSENMVSRALAEKVALKQCHDTGGSKTCRIEVSYDNQCAAIAWGDLYYNTANAETIESASEIALNACDKKAKNCKIYYTNCNYAVQINNR